MEYIKVLTNCKKKKQLIHDQVLIKCKDYTRLSDPRVIRDPIISAQSSLSI